MKNLLERDINDFYYEGYEALITEEDLKHLLDSHRKLHALEEAGVDNWEGYDYAMSRYKGEWE